MNMFRAFIELDNLNESISLTEASCPRHELIAKLKAAGKNYNFDRFSDAQLFRMTQRIEAEKVKLVEPEQEFNLEFDNRGYDYCDMCGEVLNELGQCPVCDLGEEDLHEDTQYCWFGYYLDKDGNKKLIYVTKDSTSHDADEAADVLEDLIPEPYTKFVFRGSINRPQAERANMTLVEWVAASGQQIKIPGNTASSTAGNTQSTARTSTGKYKVAIVSDKGRLRAMGDDGIHGLAFVAFPNNLRQFEGQHYEVDQLIWNGKNYRVAGNIEEI
jgi:hypothetical protein